VADLKPIDAWEEEGLHYFVFELRATDDGGADHTGPPLAVFVMHPDSKRPLSAVVVTPDGESAEVLDLRRPESAYTAPLTAPW
jgi:hypothetical protein